MMNNPIELPESLPYWILTMRTGASFSMVYSTDLTAPGLFTSETAAQHQKLIEMMRNPGAKYYVHRLDYPTTYTAE